MRTRSISVLSSETPKTGSACRFGESPVRLGRLAVALGWLLGQPTQGPRSGRHRDGLPGGGRTDAGRHWGRRQAAPCPCGLRRDWWWPSA